ncbi:RNA polymerase sigma factor [Pseudobacter ginsenosidimutans]|uniref:RNA polymerase sigma-70 factor (ECF subfamily) n=1 Tax=Pseudobacter ginsenosidimutans TaxID=661488 RepID=A0A4V2F1P9_9BACT|nr:sigma-70 family RNA polymerase sigma factor [Pseudobacter ginsenosidimutans]QEC43176.1 sigma-70 family RNA polymerase sigma factor [Pseudobacter ginsenosidimutans]RZS74536.1 RNA polymerase sigma-70 factor (ECF subfamily) [Pseudobacter ginsenosidimutans]
MEKQEDIILLNRLKAGDMQAYELLYKKYYKLLSAEAYLILEDAMEAEDQVQTLFVELWQRQLFNAINGSVKAYLQRATHNRCLKVIRKRKSVSRHFGKYLYVVNATPETTTVEKEEADRDFNMHSLLNELPLQRSEAFHLVYIENKKYKEAADHMGISINSVKTHLKLAVRSLRSRFS